MEGVLLHIFCDCFAHILWPAFAKFWPRVFPVSVSSSCLVCGIKEISTQLTLFLPDGGRPKLPGLKGMKAVKPPASVNETCVAPNVENATHPEFEHCSPPGFEDCLPPGFDHAIPLVFDGCSPAEFSSCSPLGFEDLKDDYVILCNSDYVPSGSMESWKRSGGDMSSQYALIKSTRGLPEDKSGDSVCSSSR